MSGKKRKKSANEPRISDPDVNAQTSSVIPKGWTLHTSKSNPSRQYYFHKASGKSVWELEDISKADLASNNPIQQTLKRTNNSSSDKPKRNPVHRLNSKCEREHQSRELKQKQPEKSDNKDKNAKISSSSKAIKKSKSKRLLKDADKIGQILNESLSNSRKQQKAKDSISKISSNVSRASVRQEIKTSDLSCQNLREKHAKRPKSQSERVGHENALIASSLNQHTSQSLTNHSTSKEKSKFSSPVGSREMSPSTPTMDWEDVDVQEVLQHTSKAREEVYHQGQHNMSNSPVFNDDALPSDSPGGKIKVVDTNVYISNLNLVKRIRESCTLAVPWTVIQELDKLKGVQGQVSTFARQAIRWLQQQTKKRRVGIIFQKMSDLSKRDMACESPDDRILLYCLYLKDMFGDIVSLVTDDKNLFTKANIEEIPAFESTEAPSQLQSPAAGPVTQQDCEQMSFEEEETETSPVNHCDIDYRNRFYRRTQSSDERNEDLQKIGHDFLEDILIAEMKLKHQQQWKKVIKIKPAKHRPFWSHSGLFSCYSAYYQAVFYKIYPPTFRDNLDILGQLLIRDLPDEDRLKDCLKTTCEMALSRNHEDCTEAAEVCLSKLKKLEAEVSSIDNQVVLKLLTHVWHIITVIIQGLCVTLNIPMGSDLIKPEYPLTKDFAVQYCTKFTEYLNQIGTFYEAVMNGTDSYSDLCKLLNNFKRNLEVRPHESWKNTPRIDEIQLQRFFEEENEKAKNGFQQLVQFRDPLLACCQRASILKSSAR